MQRVQFKNNFNVFKKRMPLLHYSCRSSKQLQSYLKLILFYSFLLIIHARLPLLTQNVLVFNCISYAPYHLITFAFCIYRNCVVNFFFEAHERDDVTYFFCFLFLFQKNKKPLKLFLFIIKIFRRLKLGIKIIIIGTLFAVPIYMYFHAFVLLVSGFTLWIIKVYRTRLERCLYIPNKLEIAIKVANSIK